MTPAAFLAALSRLDYSQAGFARFMAVDAVTVRRWSKGKSPVPKSVQMALDGERVPPASPENAVKGRK
jgi:DNA-binding transcriptional regulator YiaG